MNYEIQKLEEMKKMYYQKISDIDLIIQQILNKADSENKSNLINLTEFKRIKGYLNYFVNKNGDVYSLKTNKLIKPFVSNGGYISVSLWGDGKKQNYLVHRLVADAFIPNPNNYKEVNHKDLNTLNNNLENLEWCSRDYNLKYSNLEKWESKPVVQMLNNEIIREYHSITEASKYGFDVSTISKCCKNKNKKHKGFNWKYKQF
jgi:hypothetical protein